MSQWSNTDNAANSVNWASSYVNLPANTANRDALFGNTTPDAFVDGATVGVFGVGLDEVTAAREGGLPRAAHAGWVLRTVGSGGRAGRVQQEVLVAMTGGLTGDAEDVITPDYAIRINTQPAAVTTNTSVNASFNVVAVTRPAGGALTYQWTLANGDPIPGPTVVGNTTGAELVIDTSVQTSNSAYKVTISAPGGAADRVSANAALTISS